jgi:tetratricopeptide (TPR) repeat protein
MNKNLKNVFKFLSTSMLAVYAVTAVFVLLFLEHRTSVWHANAAALSRLQPAYRDLVLASDGKIVLERRQLQAYRLFFDRLLNVLGERPDAFAMRGFCEYYLGQTDQAIRDYEKAVQNASYFIWFDYNLGLLYFQKQDYDRAAKYLSQAIRSNPETAAKFMLASKLYMDAIVSIPGLDPEERLVSGLRDSYKMLVLSYYHLKRFTELIVIADVAVNQKLDDDGFFYYYLGVGAYASDQFERAALYLREAIKRNPQSAEAYYYLALTLKALGKEELAVPALQKAEIFGHAKGSSYETLRHLRLRIL